MERSRRRPLRRQQRLEAGDGGAHGGPVFGALRPAVAAAGQGWHAAAAAGC